MKRRRTLRIRSTSEYLLQDPTAAISDDATVSLRVCSTLLQQSETVLSSCACLIAERDHLSWHAVTYCFCPFLNRNLANLISLLSGQHNIIIATTSITNIVSQTEIRHLIHSRSSQASHKLLLIQKHFSSSRRRSPNYVTFHHTRTLQLLLLCHRFHR